MIDLFLAAQQAVVGSENLIGTVILLIGLELVLGVDNVLMISILTSKLKPEERSRATTLGLLLALVARIALLFGVTAILALSSPLKEMSAVFSPAWLGWMNWLSPKDLILILGGGFLLYKAVKEIHHVVEFRQHSHAAQSKTKAVFGAVITQIVILDMVFSIDSVITAVGMIPDPKNIAYIIGAVVVSFAIVMLFAKQIGSFILRHPALKILALSFLVTIGITIVMEGFQQHVNKAYIYLPMGFALVIELLQMRYSSNKAKHHEELEIAQENDA